MDLRALRYFVAVKETGSISGAARRCFVAQPSISSSLKQLEDTVGRKLFNRHARGMNATEDGEQLYPLAKQLLGQANAIEELFKGETQKVPFRLGVARGLGVQRMSQLLQKFTSANGNMELTLVPPEEVCDARIINDSMLIPVESSVSMWREEFQLALPVWHPLSLKEQLKFEDLHGLAFIQRMSCEAGQALQAKLSEAGYHLDIRARIQTIEYALGLVKAGVGCALLPSYREISRMEDMQFRPIKDELFSRHIVLAWRASSSIVDSLVDIVKP